MTNDAPGPIRVPVGHPAAAWPQGGPDEPRRGDPGRLPITPPIDIHDGPDGLTLEADLPGATASDLAIQLEHNVLTLDAWIPTPDLSGSRLIHQEFPVGDFHRSFILSDDLDRERITAELKDGVLKIHLPKSDRARARRIDIQS